MPLPRTRHHERHDMPVSRRSRPGPSCRVLPGDCLDVLPGLPEDHFDSIVTDPPYGLEFMGRHWDKFRPSGARIRQPSRKDETSGRAHNSTTSLVSRNAPESYAAGIIYQQWCEEWARECLRVLKPGGHMLAFGGTRTWHRLACAIEDAGFEIRDSIDWVYGSGFPKSKASLKPAHEPIILARRPARRSEPLPGLDACRVEGIPPSVPQPAFNSPTGRIYGMKTGEGRNGEMSQATSGRWPPNILLTHDPECVPAGVRTVRSDGHHPARRGRGGLSTTGHQGQEDLTERKSGTETVQVWDCAPGCPVAVLDEQSGVLTSGANPARRRSDKFRDAYGEFPGQTECAVHRGADSGGASRFFPVFKYQAKAPKSERPRLEDGTSWPTVKPLELMRWLARLVTEPGGRVLDPFAGTGTTGQACLAEGFSSVLIERDPVARELIRVRIPEHQ